VLKTWTTSYGSTGHYLAAAVGAALVVLIGKALSRREPQPASADKLVDLSSDDRKADRQGD
jgi:uncharacterized membrane protein YjjB (DUF3815 family)